MYSPHPLYRNTPLFDTPLEFNSLSSIRRKHFNIGNLLQGEDSHCWGGKGPIGGNRLHWISSQVKRAIWGNLVCMLFLDLFFLNNPDFFFFNPSPTPNGLKHNPVVHKKRELGDIYMLIGAEVLWEVGGWWEGGLGISGKAPVYSSNRIFSSAVWNFISLLLDGPLASLSLIKPQSNQRCFSLSCFINKIMH